MNYKVILEEGLTKRIEITETPEISERARYAILKEKSKAIESVVFAKGAKTPKYFSGYRKGHLPPNVIERYVGGKALCYNSFFNKLYQEFLKESKYKVAYLFPMTDENVIEFKPFGETKIVLELEIFPDIPEFEYEDINIKVGDPEPTEEDVTKAMALYKANNKVFVEDKKLVVELNDALYISFQGRAFLSNGTEKGIERAENILVAIGDKKYIEGATSFLPFFERNLIGKKKGENEVRFVLPDQGVEEELRNAEIKLEVLVHKIGKMVEPEITDAYVEEISKGRIKTVKEFKDDFAELTRKRKKARLEQDKEDKIFSCLLSRAGDFDLPKSMVDRQASVMAADRINAAAKGKPAEEFMKEKNINFAEFKKQFIKEATSLSRKKMIFSKIAERENFKVDDEYIKKELDTNKAYWRKSGEETIKPDVEQVKKALKASNKFQDFCDDLIAKEMMERIKSKVVEEVKNEEEKVE